MPSTVREQIREAVYAAVALETRTALVHKPGRREPFALTEVEGMATAEVAVLDDVPNEQLSAHNLEAFDFDVVAVAHMPENAADFQAWANEWYANVAKLLAAIDAPGLIKVDTAGGGGVSISDFGTVVTACAVTITYRHKRGDPWAVS